jgi:hypothetical protein
MPSGSVHSFPRELPRLVGSKAREREARRNAPLL